MDDFDEIVCGIPYDEGLMIDDSYYGGEIIIQSNSGAVNVVSNNVWFNTNQQAIDYEIGVGIQGINQFASQQLRNNNCPIGCVKICCSNTKARMIVCTPLIIGQTVSNTEISQQFADKLIIQKPLKQIRDGSLYAARNYRLTTTKFDDQRIEQIRKVKCRADHEDFSASLKKSEAVIKFVIQEKESYFAANNSIIQSYFLNTIKWKMHSTTKLNPNNKFQQQISGTILKKSDILGNWHERFVRISRKDGLRSYRDSRQTETLHIESIKQLWTRFEIIKERFLVIKLKYMLRKYQFGIPLNHYLTWSQAFYSLLQVE